MRFLLNLFIFSIILSYVTAVNVVTKFNITIQTPDNELSSTHVPYKSIHVQYTVPNSNDQWIIVAIESFIRRSKEIIQQITVHICEIEINTYQQNTIWYDDETYCNNDRSMLIYQWISYSPISRFQISEDLGFQLNQFKSIVLTVTYLKEQQFHNPQTGVILYISTIIPRFYVGTMSVGNNRKGTRFSCRSFNYPRLLYAVKPLFQRNINQLWRVYVIRSRSFGRKVVQFVVDSTSYSRENITDLEMASPDIFLIPGDYIVIECIEVFMSNCKFLIYYTYQNFPYKYFDKNDNICQTDDYPDLFKLIPSRTSFEISTIPSDVSNIHGKTIFLLILMLLFVIWISIIIGCVIMRRIRGLVNFRSEPTTPYSTNSTKLVISHARGQQQTQQKLIAEGDNIAQLDIEHMGLMS